MLTLAATETIAGIAGTVSAITASIFGMELNTGVEAYKLLYQGALGTSGATLYTCPSSTQTFVKSIHLANTTALDVTGVKLYRQGTVAANQITGSMTIPANGWATMGEDGWRIYNASGECLEAGVTSGATPNIGIAAVGKLNYKRSTTITAADPGAGFYRLSNISLATNNDVFSLHVSDTDNVGNSQKTFWNSLVASDNKINTMIAIGTGSADANGVLAKVTAVTVNSGYTTLTCVYQYGVIGAGPANNAVCDLNVWVDIGKMKLPLPPVSSGYGAGLPGFMITHQDNVALPTAAAQCHLIPFFTEFPLFVRGFIWNVQAIAASNQSVVLGIFRAGASGSFIPRLGAKVFELAAITGFLSATGAARVNALQLIPPGAYFIAFAHKALTGSPVMKSALGYYANSVNLFATGDFSQNTAMTLNTKWAISGDYTSGGLPAEGSGVNLQTFVNLASTGSAQTPAHIIMEYWPVV